MVRSTSSTTNNTRVTDDGGDPVPANPVPASKNNYSKRGAKKCVVGIREYFKFGLDDSRIKYFLQQDTELQGLLAGALVNPGETERSRDP